MSIVTLPPNCWRVIGIWGDRSCTKLTLHIHCHNCPVYASAGRELLERAVPEDYQAEWTEFFSKISIEQSDKTIDTLSVGIFRLGQEYFALSSHLFAEVTDVLPIHTIPHRTNAILLGMVNIRGEIQLCVSLHNLLGITSSDRETGKRKTLEHRRMVVIAKGSDRWVFIVDEMQGIYRLQARLFNPPTTVSKRSETYNYKVFSWHDRQVGLLEPELLFRSLSRRLLC
ncbi:MAG: chemotaxis protein CheW [Pseudanabaenaceae cyanobacterium SKYGB_i_bin29]|nr:chemotaxis protein CheW [Pseudanabaenaceae cyanobacterium SKYG29]MDW8420361.1 chemotaxis protein CheW [Pseudanabaenaceae cyanobacterium SKYGB_i_bin29]